MKIKKLVTKQGEEVLLEDINILVGPNNVGKSQTLQDIRMKVIDPDPNTVLVNSVHYKIPNKFDEMIQNLDIRDSTRHLSNKLIRGIGSSLGDGVQIEVNLVDLKKRFEEGNLERVVKALGQFYISFLNASSRLQITTSRESQSANEDAPQNLLQALYAKCDETNATPWPFEVIFLGLLYVVCLLRRKRCYKLLG